MGSRRRGGGSGVGEKKGGEGREIKRKGDRGEGGRTEAGREVGVGVGAGEEGSLVHILSVAASLKLHRARL